MEPISQWALATGLAWASGFRLYAAVFLVGVLGWAGYVDLPPSLQVLQHPWVLLSAGVMLVGEFIADKIPAFDTLWDAMHAVIRIPAGMVLAWAAMGDADPATQLVAGLLGGFITSGTYLAKSGSRALVNTSPEPFSNWGLSFSEDGVVLLGIWLAIQHPWVFLVLLLVFLVAVAWLLPRLWRLFKRLLTSLRRSPR
ncbi:MAG: DUF4126 domain-containing protein [Dokdonella sp.]